LVAFSFVISGLPFSNFIGLSALGTFCPFGPIRCYGRNRTYIPPLLNFSSRRERPNLPTGPLNHLRFHSFRF
jgi:hypothetical protein